MLQKVRIIMALGANLPTRFDYWPRWGGLCLCLCLLALIALGVKTGVASDPISPEKMRSAASAGIVGDGYLYQAIVHRMKSGASYYVAASTEQRARGYPLRPVFTVREPTLAWLMSSLPSDLAQKICLAMLGLLGLGGWGWWIHRQFSNVSLTAWSIFCLLGADVFAFLGKSYFFHECWAGILLLISFAAYNGARTTRGHAASGWLVVALLSALLAVMIRELAAPYLLVMAVMAFAERRGREGALWLGTIIIFALFMLWHAQMVASYVQPGDSASPGWVRFGGWEESLRMLKWNGLLLQSPDIITIILIPVIFLGAIGWPGALGCRLFLLSVGYAAGFCLFGRPENGYWGLVVTPLLGLGLCYAPISLWRLGQRMVRKV